MKSLSSIFIVLLFIYSNFINKDCITETVYDCSNNKIHLSIPPEFKYNRKIQNLEHGSFTTFTFSDTSFISFICLNTSSYIFPKGDTISECFNKSSRRLLIIDDYNKYWKKYNYYNKKLIIVYGGVSKKNIMYFNDMIENLK